MKVVVVVSLALALARVAHADDKALKPYAGKVVMSPDTPPTVFDELPSFLKANISKDGVYELIKWDVNFVGVLAKPSDKVTLVVTDPGEKDPLVTMELSPKRQVVVGHFTPTKAAGFAEGKSYAVTLVAGKATVAKAELVLRR
jgi:hypothetical protein